MGIEFKRLLLAQALAFAPLASQAAGLDDVVDVLDKVGKIADAIAPAKTDGSKAASPAADSKANVGAKDIVVASGFVNGAPSGVASSFLPTVKRVYVCYTPVNMEQGALVQALWHHAGNGSMDRICSVSSTVSGSAKAEFHLEIGSGVWPSGAYRVDLVANGAVLGSASFTIDPNLASSSATGGVFTPAQASPAPQPKSEAAPAGWEAPAAKPQAAPVQAQETQPSQDKGAKKTESTKALDDFFSN